MWQLVVLCNEILIKVVGYQLYPNYTLNKMITGSSTLLQVYSLYNNKIREKERKNWRYNLYKYHNMETANRKSHNYAVNQLIRECELDYTPDTFKLMSLIINEKFSVRKMSIVKLDIALFKLANYANI